MVARIFRPSKTAMQSGRAKTKDWVLVYEPEEPLSVEPLMGYTASTDMKRQIRLSFETREAAIAYAEREGIPFQVFEAEERQPKTMSYADNFRHGRRGQWTH